MQARLKTGIWVDAFLRQGQTQGRYGAVIHKGAEEAGSVVLVINRLDGTHDILEPSPGSATDEAGNRRFIKTTKAPCTWPEAAERIARMRKFDSDVWVVEVEDRVGFGGASVET